MHHQNSPTLLRQASRVLVLGCCGAGKSVLSRKLGAALDLPVIHLDQNYHGPNWQEPPRDVWEERLAELLARDRWVMDGNYAASLDRRFARADAIVWLDYGRAICLPRLLRRSLTYWCRQRPDAAPGCRESFGGGYLEFLKFAWTWHEEYRPELVRKLTESNKPVLQFRNPRETRRALTPPSAHPTQTA